MKSTDRVSQILNSYKAPAILVSKDYEIIATNSRYSKEYGELDSSKTNHCFAVSHGYKEPCDKSGESCPLKSVLQSKEKEHVLHIHESKNGREYVDIEMVPVFSDDSQSKIDFFIEVLNPVNRSIQYSRAGKVIGESNACKTTVEDSIKAAKSKLNVLLSGKTGTGKKLIAHLIHSNSKRSAKPVIIVDCVGMTSDDFEVQVFGEENEGNLQLGLAEQAHDGTLVFDKVDELSLQNQAKLLKLIKTRAFRRVGGSKLKHSNFRVISTCVDGILDKVKSSNFRGDLYYLLSAFPINVPSLDERREDIPLLARYILGDTTKKQITQSAIDLLTVYDFGGNVSQLRNILLLASALSDTNLIDDTVISSALMKSPDGAPSSLSGTESNLDLSLKEVEAQHLKALLIKFQGDKAQVAEAAGISLRSLYRKLD